MSLFRNRNKKFENDLQKQLGNHEVKPSDALWDKLSQELGEDGFEQKVQTKLDNYELPPHKDTWQKIEAELPLEPKEKAAWNRLAIIPLVLLVLFSGIFIGREMTLNNGSEKIEVGDWKLEAGSQNSEIRESKFKGESNVVSEINADKEIKVDRKRIALKEDRAKQSVSRADAVLTSTPLSERQGVRGNHKNDKGDSHLRVNDGTPQPSFTKENKTSATKKSTSDFVIANSTQTNSTTIVEQNNMASTINTSTPEGVSEEVRANNYSLQRDSTITAKADTMTETIITLNDVKDTSASVQTYTSTPKKDDKYDEEKPSRLSIIVTLGVHNSMMYLQAPDASAYDLRENIALRKQLEKPKIDWSGGFYADFTLNEKWRIAVGISTLSFTQEFNYDLVPATGLPNSEGENGIPVYNPNDSVVGGSLYNNRIHYSWTEIPVLVTYKITSNPKWNLELQGGLSYAILNAIDASMVSYDNTGLLLLRDKQSFPYLQNNFFAIFNPAVSYTLKKDVFISLMPTVKASLNPMFKNNDWVEQYPYFVGLGVSLRKRF